jgi:hypothetical protein
MNPSSFVIRYRMKKTETQRKLRFDTISTSNGGVPQGDAGSAVALAL